MSANRFDLYTATHKAIRQILFDLSSMEGRTDYADRASSTTLADRTTRALSLVNEHAANEDREMIPPLERHAPAVASRLRAQHHDLDTLAEKVLECAANLVTAGDAERPVLGRTLHVLVNRLLAGHLDHMALEEDEGNAAFWAALSDPELLEIQRRILSPVPPPRMAEWMQWMLPALNTAERNKLASAHSK